jgi:hypothetical protein
MNGHLAEDRLIALRDDAAYADDEVREHLAACAACRRRLEALRERAAAVSAALHALDAESEEVTDDTWDAAARDARDVERARARVRERVAEATAAKAGTATVVGRRSRGAMVSLSRAAGILLVTAAAASALPGSPVRRWLSETIGNDDAAVTAPAPVEIAPTAAAAETTGVRLSVPSGALRVVLQDVVAGTDVRVVIVPGTEAAVFAPAGSRFTSAAGRLEARVTPGEIRVELPTGVDPVSLEVGGRIYLQSTGERLDVRGPVSSRTEDEILFRIPG